MKKLGKRNVQYIQKQQKKRKTVTRNLWTERLWHFCELSASARKRQNIILTQSKKSLAHSPSYKHSPHITWQGGERQLG